MHGRMEVRWETVLGPCLGSDRFRSIQPDGDIERLHDAAMDTHRTNLQGNVDVPF